MTDSIHIGVQGSGGSLENIKMKQCTKKVFEKGNINST